MSGKLSGCAAEPVSFSRARRGEKRNTGRGALHGRHKHLPTRRRGFISAFAWPSSRAAPGSTPTAEICPPLSKPVAPAAPRHGGEGAGGGRAGSERMRKMRRRQAAQARPPPHHGGACRGAGAGPRPRPAAAGTRCGRRGRRLPLRHASRPGAAGRHPHRERPRPPARLPCATCRRQGIISRPRAAGPANAAQHAAGH